MCRDISILTKWPQIGVNISQERSAILTNGKKRWNHTHQYFKLSPTCFFDPKKWSDPPSSPSLCQYLIVISHIFLNFVNTSQTTAIWFQYPSSQQRHQKGKYFYVLSTQECSNLIYEACIEWNMHHALTFLSYTLKSTSLLQRINLTALW